MQGEKERRIRDVDVRRGESIPLTGKLKEGKGGIAGKKGALLLKTAS